MKNFIEIEYSEKSKKMLINVNHIVSIKEVFMGNGKSFAKIQLSEDDDRTFTVDKGKNKPTEYVVSRDLSTTNVRTSYSDLVKKIKDATQE